MFAVASVVTRGYLPRDAGILPGAAAKTAALPERFCIENTHSQCYQDARIRQSDFKRQPLGDEEALRLATASLVKLL
jgi:hypothetical protein